MDNLKDILMALIQIRNDVGLKNWDDNSLADCGVRIYNSQNIKEVKENKSKNPPSEKMKYSLINNYGYTEEEVDKMDYQQAYDTIKKEKAN